MSVNKDYEYQALYEGIDPMGDRLTFSVGRNPRRRSMWLLWRETIGCFETGSFETATDAMWWGSQLTHRRPVKWNRIPHLDKGGTK